MEIQPLDEEEMQIIYNWVDEIPLTRPKRNIARDFSDGGKVYSLVYVFNTLLWITLSDIFEEIS